MISVELVGDREVIARFEAMPANARSNIARTVAKLGFETEALTKRKLSGQVLNVGTGLLRSSINTKTTADSNSATATIGTNVKYAGIHEFGGTIHVPEIRPKSARALMLPIGGQVIFRMSARAHDVHMPERSFLRSALNEMRPKIQSEIAEAVGQTLRE